MPGTIGNTNNLKWTFETAQEFFEDLYETVKNDEKCSSLAYATSKLGYYETLVQYLKDKFKEIDFEPIKKAETLIKSRIMQKGLENEYNPAMSIFILKNNHGMNDKLDVTTGGEKIQPQKGMNVTLPDGTNIDDFISRVKK
ncbi:hypothetical protein ACJRPK_13980 [Aquimarina sp. 2-A2]|uniref:hypothetical protein n=1 Tax=Aquimarina sp. 2-A2 TaxID=3382644 RepID=UPI00387F2C6E